MSEFDNIENETLIICEYNTKIKLLKKLTKEKKLLNIKILSMRELVDRLYFTYDVNSILYLMEKYNYTYEVAKMYLDNLIFLEDKSYKNEKLIQLQVLKNELEEHNLLLRDDLFNEFVKGKDIIFYNYDYFTSFDKRVIDDLKKVCNVLIKEKQYNNYSPKLYEFNTSYDEIEFVACEISKLISNGVCVNDIKLTNLDDSYLRKIQMIFELYGLPLFEVVKTSLYETEIGQCFLDNYQDDISHTICFLNDKFSDKDTINMIVNILNKYVCFNDFNRVKDLVIYDLKNTYVRKKSNKNFIEVVDYNDLFEDDKYVFMLNFNQKSIPKYKRDEDFLTDNLKDELNLDKVCYLNKLIKESTIKNIKNIKNLVITYKVFDNGECYVSSLASDLNLFKEVFKQDNSVSYSFVYNELKLAKKLDNYIKYNEVDDELVVLNNNYDIPYLKYDNNYSKIDRDSLYKYLDNKLNLSYTKMDMYNKCSFAYYVKNILKIDLYEKNIAALYGSIFHYCLEKGLIDDIDIDSVVDNFIKDNNYSLSYKQLHFINRIKKEIEFAIDVIRDQMKYQGLDKILTEQEVIVNKKGILDVVFKGVIDKILYNDKNEITIIDYKTGNTDIKLDLVDYGLSMQLPVYLYLANNLDKIKGPIITGFYLQQVLHSEIVFKSNKTYIEQKIDGLKLNGYSNSDKDVIKEFDNCYYDSKFIKGLRLDKNGNFDFRSKVISSDDINELICKTDNIIDDVIKSISDACFDINPKIINGVNKSCEYCKYNDLCYKTSKNNVYIKIEKES